MSRKHTPEEREQATRRRQERQRRWAEANRGRGIAATRRWRAANPEKYKASSRRANLKLYYGVSPEWFDATLAAQGGCAICRTTDAAARGGWHVDHDHATGKVRGVLCGHCNRALGLLNDCGKTCGAAMQYLIRGFLNVS